eukprot:1526327-Prymnesium_polylepis.1
MGVTNCSAWAAWLAESDPLHKMGFYHGRIPQTKTPKVSKGAICAALRAPPACRVRCGRSASRQFLQAGERRPRPPSSTSLTAGAQPVQAAARAEEAVWAVAPGSAD